MAAFDAFLKIDGIDGESADKEFPKHIEVLSYSFGVNSQGPAPGVGVGTGGGKVDVNDFSFTHVLNAASPKLFLAACRGDHISTAVLRARRAGENQEVFLTITLTDVQVSSIADGGSAGGAFLPVEQISLNFSKIEFEYKPQRPDGSLGPPIKTTCGGHKT